MDVLCGMPTIQYSARSARLSVHKLFTSCIRRCLVSRACDWVMSALSAVLLIDSFQFRPAFLPCRSAGRSPYWKPLNWDIAAMVALNRNMSAAVRPMAGKYGVMTILPQWTLGPLCQPVHTTLTILRGKTANIMKRNWFLFLFVVKGAALKQQIPQFYPYILNTEASFI